MQSGKWPKVRYDPERNNGKKGNERNGSKKNANEGDGSEKREMRETETDAAV